MTLRILCSAPLVAALCLLGNTTAAANAGKIIFATGEAHAEGPQGVTRRLQRSDLFERGDTLVTGNGKLQARFTDGGLISVQPHSRFAVTDYHFVTPTDGNDKAVLNLLKGGMRAITGAIGARARASYSVTTPVATIGIRGTGFTLRYCAGDCPAVNGQPQPDGLYVSTQDGTISLTNGAGALDLTVGQSAFVATRSSAPALIDTPPLLLPPPDDTLGLAAYIAGEQVTDAGDNLTLFSSIFTPRSVFDGYASQSLIGVYDILGAGSAPTDNFGNIGTFDSGFLMVTFAEALVDGQFQFTIVSPATATTGQQPVFWSLDFSTTFLPDATRFSAHQTAGTMRTNCATCSLDVSGGLTGPNAEAVVLNYAAQDSATGQIVSGSQTLGQSFLGVDLGIALDVGF